MTDRDTTTRTRARAPGVGGVFHRMAVHDRVLRPDSERTTVATTKCTKGGCKLDGGRRMPGAGLSRRSPRKAPLGQSAFQPYWGKLAVRNDRGDRGNVGIIRSPIRASILPDHNGLASPNWSEITVGATVTAPGDSRPAGSGALWDIMKPFDAALFMRFMERRE